MADKKISRRSFLQSTALIGGAAMIPSLLMGGNADILNDLILLPQSPQKTLSRHRLEPCGTPPLPRARPSVAIQLRSVLPDDRRICTTPYRNIKHEFLIGMLGSDAGNFPTDVLFNLCDMIIHSRKFKPCITEKNAVNFHVALQHPKKHGG